LRFIWAGKNAGHNSGSVEGGVCKKMAFDFDSGKEFDE
jgi:hypothetical protein